MTRRYLATLVLGLCSAALPAQNDKVVVSGSIQSDILIPQDDDKIGTESTDDWALTNTYVDANVMSKHLDGGLRFEFTEHPLPGFENDFKGWGVPYAYLKAHFDKIEVTAGSFYEQFGSGFILRTYEERGLGIDNSLVGARVTARPVKGLTVKALSGKQRRYWSLNKGIVSGADAEIDLSQWSKKMQDAGTSVSIGASWVNKYEKQEDIFADATHKYNLPEYVNAFDGRVNVKVRKLSILAEYAWKSQDPSFDNGYSYDYGNVGMLSASYADKGLSILAQARRNDNMSFRSKRSMNGTSSFINHLPAFTMDHTYALAALYPYATHPEGEWAFQTEIGYRFKKNTVIGGKYGTSMKVNFSHVRALHHSEGTDSRYYQDLNIQVDKKLSRDWKINLMYMNQFYNKTIVEGEGGMIHSDIIIADAKYRINKKMTLRGEAQYLFTDDDQGDWAFGLLELSILPHFMITVSDEYNVGETDIHYYQGSVTFNTGAHRIQAGYGRTRAGFNCSGGVCRYVPATKGFTLSYNYNF